MSERGIGEDEEIERDEQQRDDQQTAARGFQLPVMQRVLARAEQGRGDAGEDEEGEIGQ
jgi:hypothetical protein